LSFSFVLNFSFALFRDVTWLFGGAQSVKGAGGVHLDP